MEELAREITITVTKNDLIRMLKVFEDKKNDIGIHSYGDMVMIAQLQIEIEKFERGENGGL